jgi:hypothetical protein
VFFTVEKNAKRSTGRNTKRCASDSPRIRPPRTKTKLCL